MAVARHGICSGKLAPKRTEMHPMASALASRLALGDYPNLVASLESMLRRRSISRLCSSQSRDRRYVPTEAIPIPTTATARVEMTRPRCRSV